MTDPVAEGVQFLLAILAGGLVAVIAARISFRDAQRLAREGYEEGRRAARHEQAVRDRGQRRTLFVEIEQNIRALENLSPDQLARLHRSAWDMARGLAFPHDLFEILQEAYIAVDLYNAEVDVVRAMLPSHGRDSTNVVNAARYAATLAQEAHRELDKAYALLLAEEPDPMAGETEGDAVRGIEERRSP
jgi:hypothetical protein